MGSAPRASALAVCLCLAAAAPRAATAVDGVIEINQARALTGGVTPADTAGFPVTLDANGSYRLTGDLTLPDKDTTAIQIGPNATWVTIDLNGFSIVGVVSCTIPPSLPPAAGSITCSPSPSSGDAIHGNFDPIYYSNSNIRVINGTIRGMGEDGIDIARGEIENVTLAHNKRYGIIVQGDGAKVINSKAISNGNHGLQLLGKGNVVRGSTLGWNGGRGVNGYTALVTESMCVGNIGAGIYLSESGTVVGNAVSYNGSTGVQGGNLTVLDNNIMLNSLVGISVVSALGGYGRNVLVQNNGGSANGQVLGVKEIPVGSNICGTNTCPP